MVRSVIFDKQALGIEEILSEINLLCEGDERFRIGFFAMVDRLIDLRSDYEDRDEIECHLKNLRNSKSIQNNIIHSRINSRILENLIEVIKLDSILDPKSKNDWNIP